MPIKPAENFIMTETGQAGISLEAMMKIVEDATEKQAREMEHGMTPEEIALGAPYSGSYRTLINSAAKALEMTAEMVMADTFNTEVLISTIEDTIESFHVEVTDDVLKKGDAEFGYFMEENLFGLARDNKMTSDLDRWRNMKLSNPVEIKSKKVINAALSVGGVAVMGLDALTAIEKKDLERMMILYKMITKMKNLLYLHFKENPDNPHQLGIRAIILYTELYIKALEAEITGLGKKSLLDIRRHHDPWQGKWKAKLDIELKLLEGKGDESIRFMRNLERLKQLYLVKIDMVNEFHTGGVRAAEFFGRIRKIREWIKG